jgi:hypothetical protein
MHIINNARGKLTSFTYTSWCNFVIFAAKWKKFICKEGEIAHDSEAKLDLRLDLQCEATHTDNAKTFLPIPAYCKFHRECYNRFCNKQKLEREERRQAVRDENAQKGER